MIGFKARRYVVTKVKNVTIDEFNHAYAGGVAAVKWNFDFGTGKTKAYKMRAEYDKLIHTKALPR